MAAVNIYILDPSDDPIEGVSVLINSVITGNSIELLSNVDGKVSLSLSAGKYSVSSSKPGYLSSAASVFEVVDPVPADTAAYYRPPAQAVVGLITASKHILKIGVDLGLDVTIDLNVPSAPLTIDDIVSRINTALGASIAENVLDEVRLTSTTTGADSEIRIINEVGDPLENAVDAVFGLVVEGGSVTVNGQDNSLANDFEVTLTPRDLATSTKPGHCVISGNIYEDRAFMPMGRDAHIMMTVEPLLVPGAAALGTELGNQFYVTPDEDGYVEFELVQGSVVRAHVFWMDVDIQFSVPFSPSADLIRLLSPYVVDIFFEFPTLNIEVGDEFDLNPVKGTNTDGSILDVNAFEFTSDNEDSVIFNGSVATAVAVGSSQVTARALNSRGEELISNPITVFVDP